MAINPKRLMPKQLDELAQEIAAHKSQRRPLTLQSCAPNSSGILRFGARERDGLGACAEQLVDLGDGGGHADRSVRLREE